ncbi:MAG: aromatic ring-hydroxylating dioxygenase subunit alpha [Gammaproteobacteria bacterium]|nr:aromatic ring-hydroxylating dioxygenase subunit alpha [Gammaproteobacteria bacterium]
MTEIQGADRTNFDAFCGYHQTWAGQPDPLLTRTGPGTPCGEFLRRYWHPVFIAGELGDQPKLIKILGEELVLFRDRSGRYGLVHKHCPHRRASLEYGRCENRGIRCCYHGWLFDIDGTVLDLPGEPENSRSATNVKSKMRLGAYPVREYRGLLFAYLGPASETPEFPIYDTFEIPEMVMTPYAAPFECNWIQVLDAIVDPVHTAFLHHSQFSDGFGVLGEIEFYHRDRIRFLGTATRRVRDNVWVRVNELILPNFTQSGAAFATDGSRVKYFGRSAFTRWVVPVDDHRCIAYAWGNFGDRGDPMEWNTPEGMQIIEQGELIDRTYEEKQASPGDVEAVEGMGRISDHEKEYLVSGDRGVVMYRTQIKKLCRSLQRGKPPPQPGDLGEGVIPTYGSDTVIRCQEEAGTDDAEVLRDINARVMDTIFAGDALDGAARDHEIIRGLKTIA